MTRSVMTLALLLVPFTAASQVATNRDTIEIAGWRLIGDRVSVGAARAPFVLLLHKAAGNRFAFAELATLLAERGIGSLRIDLPGHGQSTNLGTFVPGDPAGIPETDVVPELLRRLRRLPEVDPASLGVVAGSYTAELAARAGRVDGFAAAYVMMSPGSLSDSSIAAIRASGAAWLLIRSPNERFVRAWLDTLASRTGAELWISDANAAHASDILLADRAAAPRIADWLAARLGRSGSPALDVTYLANEGVMLETSAGRVLIDALFGDGLEGYARVERPLRDSLERARGRFGGRVLVLATHAHRDHFDAAAVARYLAANPAAVAVVPPDARRRLTALSSPPPGAQVRDGDSASHAFGWVTVRALGMPHGSTRNRVDHAAYLVELDGWTALHIGDTQLPPIAWDTLGLPASGVDVALVPYWYLMNAALEAQLRAHAKPRRIVVLHGPPAGADSEGMRRLGGWQAWTRELESRHDDVWVPRAAGEHRMIDRSPR